MNRGFSVAASEPAAVSHELLHPESVNGAGKTVSFRTVRKKGVTYTSHAICSEKA